MALFAEVRRTTKGFFPRGLEADILFKPKSPGIHMKFDIVILFALSLCHHFSLPTLVLPVHFDCKMFWKGTLCCFALVQHNA